MLTSSQGGSLCSPVRSCYKDRPRQDHKIFKPTVSHRGSFSGSQYSKRYLKLTEFHEIGNNVLLPLVFTSNLPYGVVTLDYIHQYQTFFSLEILKRTCILWQWVLLKGGNGFQKATQTLFFQNWKDMVWTIRSPAAARTPYVRGSLAPVPPGAWTLAWQRGNTGA